MNPSGLKTLQSAGLVGTGPLAPAIAELGPWFHNLHLPDGSQTAPDHPLGDFPKMKWDVLAPLLPADLHGARVLDIGCNAGFYSLELAHRGAEVIAIDPDVHYLRQARWAAEQWGVADRIDYRELQVYDIQLLGEFDVVVFMGVFYHLRYPVLALDLVGEAARDLLVFQSLTMRDGKPRSVARELDFDELEEMNDRGWPKLAFVEHELAGDQTNWWVPNDACVEGLLHSAGFTIEAKPGHELFVCRRAREFRAIRSAFADQLDAVLGRICGPARALP